MAKAAKTSRKANVTSDNATGSRRDGAAARAKLLEKAMEEFAEKVSMRASRTFRTPAAPTGAWPIT
ncbi:hypothetical protein, partial [Corallococcus praedator]|uniref:hypothetical protein n=1 Tax=Corallococcus praedator TaxID=2316724 RepID=UPI001ABF0B81